MATEHLLKYLSVLQILISITLLLIMLKRRVAPVFPALVSFVALASLSTVIKIPLMFYRQTLGIDRVTAYEVYFASGWLSQIGCLCLLVLIIYGLFSEAMRPFPGLQRIGRIIFKWVGSVSFLVAVALAIGPELFAKGATLAVIYAELTGRFQQGMNVLVLCLLIFVSFSIRPLGLTFRSHIFGVVLGLGVYSTLQLAQSAWLVTTGASSPYSGVYLLDPLSLCFSAIIWGIYFGLPEPKRRMILLPTTSPFFLWNRISEILGDEPGQVAVAGFHPDMLAPAEIQMLTAATSREAAAAREREQLGRESTTDLLPTSFANTSRVRMTVSR